MLFFRIGDFKELHFKLFYTKELNILKLFNFSENVLLIIYKVFIHLIHIAFYLYLASL